MKTNYFLHSILTLGFILIGSFSLYATPKKSPNVIYICGSDFGKGLLSAYGQRYFTTPNLDALINNGIRFSNAYGGSLSAHARASLLTGYHDCNQDKWRISNGGVYIKEDTAYIKESEFSLNSASIYLPENDLYLQQVFSQAGYLTAQIGKLGIGNASTRQQMAQYGWDYFYGFLDLVRSEGYYPTFLFENDKMVLIEGNTRKDGGVSFTPETELAYQARWNMEGKKTYAPDLFMQKILDFIREAKNSSFFLMYSSPLPRGPVSVPAIHPEVAGNDALTPIEKEYASMVKYLDDQVGVILKELQSLGLESNTIVVFGSDNGHDITYQQPERIVRPYLNNNTKEFFDNFYNKYRSVEAGDVFNGNAGLAGIKYSNLNGGITIPLTFYWKGKFREKVYEDIVAGYDILPTMAELVGVKLTAKKNGLSLLPTLTKGKKLPKNRYIITGSGEGPAIITNEGWKLRYHKVRQVYELFNLKRDPEEKYDVKLRFPEVVQKLGKTLLTECDGNINNGILF